MSKANYTTHANIENLKTEHHLIEHFNRGLRILSIWPRPTDQIPSFNTWCYSRDTAEQDSISLNLIKFKVVYGSPALG